MKTYKVEINDAGTKRWYKPGTDDLHREDGPAIEWAIGTKSWWIDGHLHRVDGPAIEYASGSKEWWINGQLHRTDGPAIEFVDGHKEWWINCESLTEDEFNNRNRPLIGEKVNIKGVDYVLA